ncbi:hypothetical protein [Microbacterium esteraromaticum]|uniref:hypothetical protein n=1 Tax=Microbacterium esteraromaticum TaxID=57043 RepID=UPI00195D7775|nr:hypothetical protein [Microbacterium esteraromaticum]MBM7466091.1 hypothetical protein [Microbacterium esteraromaticum]
MSASTDQINTFANGQAPAVERAARLILERVDFNAMLAEAGVDLTGADAVTIEFVTDVDEVGTLKKRPGDGKGCITVCVGWGPAKVCWKNCDD